MKRGRNRFEMDTAADAVAAVAAAVAWRRRRKRKFPLSGPSSKMSPSIWTATKALGGVRQGGRLSRGEGISINGD